MATIVQHKKQREKMRLLDINGT